MHYINPINPTLYDRHRDAILAYLKDGGSWSLAEILRGLRLRKADSIPLQSASFPIRKCGICGLDRGTGPQERQAIVTLILPASRVRAPLCAKHAFHYALPTIQERAVSRTEE